MSSVAEGVPRSHARWQTLHALLRDPLGALGLALVLLILLIALFAPLLAPYDPAAISVRDKLQGPSLAHMFGTDHLGRDTMSRIIFGARVALSVAVISIGVAMLGGITLGLVAGYGPRWLDNSLVLLFDTLNSLPVIMLALAVITVLGPGTGTLIFFIALVSTPGYARLIRAQTLALKKSEFVMAERSMGASATRIIFLHLLPNVIGPLIVLISMDIPTVIMLEAGLSYLGLGVKPPTPSWGSILFDGYTYLRASPTLVITGGIPLVLATLGFTFLGEALRDALDPKLKGRRLA